MSARYCRNFSFLVMVCAVTCAVLADDAPPAAPPPAPAETPAIRCARHDVARWTERVVQLRQAAEAAVAPVTTAQQALEAAKVAGNTPEDALKKLMTDVEAATKAKAAADMALAQGEASAKSATDRLNAFVASPPKADPTTIRQIGKFAHDRILMSCRFDANGDFLYTGTQGNDAHRWNLFTSERQDFKGHGSWVARVEPMANGQFLTGGYEGKLGLWDGLTPTGQPARMADAHQGHLRTLAVSADGRLVATGGNDQVVKIWNLADGALVHALAGHASHVYSVAFDPTGTTLFSGDLMGVIKQWNVADGKHVRDLDAGPLHKFDTGFVAHVGGVRGMEVSPDGKSLVAVGVGNVSNAFAGIG
ncbi:MAG TPA: hypothetical protein VHB77_13105, partial [Planctomycetaceae bacterium]|nr:hypothetical protein [Planctomycetaceae bacterium]